MKSLIKITLVLLTSALALMACDGTEHTLVSVPQKPTRKDLEKMQCQLDGQLMNCLDFAKAGEELFSQKCERCHDPIEWTTLIGIQKRNIDIAIRRVQKMSELGVLTSDQRSAISLALNL